MCKSIPTNRFVQCQPLIQLLQQGCSTNVYGGYMWFDFTTTLCYLRHPFEYVSQHISSPHSFLNTPLSMLQTCSTSSGPPTKKINLQSPYSTRLSSFHPEIFRSYYTSIQVLLYNPVLDTTQDKQVIYRWQDG